MLRIGLTGGIGSGKSSVARLFAEIGVPVIDTDEISRALTEPGAAGYLAVVDRFGTEVLDSRNKIDRRRLRDRVFAEPEARRSLEAILHPLIRKETEKRLAMLRVPYAVVVVPLLFEAGFDELIDRVLVVDTDEATQVRRVVRRDGADPDDVRAIIAAQLSRDDRSKRADDVIDNNSSLDVLKTSVAELHERYLALARNNP